MITRRLLAQRHVRCLLAAAVAASFAAGCTYPCRIGVDESLNEPLRGAQSLNLKSRNGRIEIRGDASATEIKIAATKSASGNTPAEARQFAEEIEISTSRIANGLHIEPTYPDRDNARNYAVDFLITMPPDVALALSTSNGRVTVNSMNRDVNVETSNGRVDLQEIEGKVKADTSNGRISIKNVRGDLDLDTSNGEIVVTASGDKSIRCTTSNGAIRMTAVRGNSHVRTSNGPIELQIVELPDAPTVDVRSSNGGVTVEVPSTASGRLNMSTSNGRLATDFEAATVRDLQSSRRSLTATLNGGAGSIDIVSSNGSLTFRTTKLRLD